MLDCLGFRSKRITARFLAEGSCEVFQVLVDCRIKSILAKRSAYKKQEEEEEAEEAEEESDWRKP